MKFAIFYLKNRSEALKSDIVHILLAIFDPVSVKVFYLGKGFKKKAEENREWRF